MQNELPKRKQIRLKNYDYSDNGYYFITICTKNKKPLLWKSVGAAICRPELSKYGKIAEKAIQGVSKHYSSVKIDKYVIMPDHIHLILIINSDNGRQVAAPTVMRVIGNMKRFASKEAEFSLWQKSFYEHVIRDEADYKKILEYMETNVLKREIKERSLQKEGI